MKVTGPKLGASEKYISQDGPRKDRKMVLPCEESRVFEKVKEEDTNKVIDFAFFLSNERLECGGDVRWAFRLVNLTHKEGGEKVSERAVAESYESEVSQGENP